MNVTKMPVGPSGVTNWMVRYEITRDTGEKKIEALIDPSHQHFIHVFPEERILSLIAEYGLDPDNMEDVMDVLLAEPFLDPQDGEPTLFADEDPEIIREAHRRRAARAKLAVRLTTRGIENPVEMLRNIPLDRSKIAEISHMTNQAMTAMRQT